MRGGPARPVVVGFVLSRSNSATRQAQQALAETLNEAAQGMTMTVESYDSMRAALDAVCGEETVLAWVDAFTYFAAEQACGAEPRFTVRQSSRAELPDLPDDITVNIANGTGFDVVYTSRLGTMDGLNDLATRTICRLGPDDPISWIYLSLAFRAIDINPLELPTAVDVEDYVAMFEAIDDGDCDVGAIPRGTREDLADAADIDAENFKQLSSSWPLIPNKVLIARADVWDVQLTDELDVETLLRELVDDENEDLLTLTEAEDIASATSRSHSQFKNWLTAAGWEMVR